jgi:septum formation protein
MDKIILATSSPYRKEAFSFLGLDFIAQGSDVNEYSNTRPDLPEELVLYLSKLKAQAVAKNYNSGIIIGFDSVGWHKGKILEKPKSKEEAFKRLKSLSGNSHEHYTGIYILNLGSGKELSKVVVTKVKMRKITDSEINKYLKQDSGFNTYSLGYDPLSHYSSTFIKEIQGSYNNLLRGIPLEIIIEMLIEIGYKI